MFIISSLPDVDPLTRNLLTFCITAPLMPLAYFISRIIKAEFSVKENELNNLGLLFSINQILYILIAMWVYSAVPDKMVMAVIISIGMLIIGNLYDAKTVSLMMVAVEIIFSILLIKEVREILK